MIRNLSLILFALLFVGEVAFAQDMNACPTALSYDNKNQVDPKPLRLSIVSGKVSDEQGISVPDVCLGLFAEAGKKIVKQTLSDQSGKFAFGSLPAGKYRLIARYSPFCIANIPIEVVEQKQKSKLRRKKIIVHMKPSGIDSCSYGDYK